MAAHAPSIEGQVLGAPAMLGVAVLTVVGLWTSNIAMLLLGGLILALSLISKLLAHLSLYEVVAERHPSAAEVPEGDIFTLTFVLENRKPFPVTRIRLTEYLPDGLELVNRDDLVGELIGHTTINETISLSANERVRIHRRVAAMKRGRYRLGPTFIDSGDPFGFFQSKRKERDTRQELLVYPRIHSMPSVALPFRDGAGRRPSPLTWREDPTRPNGVREYIPGDPMKRLDWGAFARRGEPFTRTYDTELVENLIVAVECGTSEAAWRFDPERLEAVASAGATVAKFAIDRQLKVGVIANGVPPSASTPNYLAANTGMGHLKRILAVLASIQSIPMRPLDLMLADRFRRASSEPIALVLVAARISPAIARLLGRLRRQGVSVSVMYLGADPLPTMANVAVHRVFAHFRAPAMERPFDGEQAYRPRHEREKVIHA
ncbi:MAG: DUF58 domain-containing protein [Pseudomonadota bacterium]